MASGLRFLTRGAGCEVITYSPPFVYRIGQSRSRISARARPDPKLVLAHVRQRAYLAVRHARHADFAAVAHQVDVGEIIATVALQSTILRKNPSRRPCNAEPGITIFSCSHISKKQKAQLTNQAEPRFLPSCHFKTYSCPPVAARGHV